jgi:hypothetical protein
MSIRRGDATFELSRRAIAGNAADGSGRRAANCLTIILGRPIICRGSTGGDGRKTSSVLWWSQDR